MGAGKAEKIDRGLKKLRKDYGRLLKVARWLATTNDFKDGDAWTRALKRDTEFELIGAEVKVLGALHQMEMLKEWLERKDNKAWK